MTQIVPVITARRRWYEMGDLYTGWVERVIIQRGALTYYASHLEADGIIEVTRDAPGKLPRLVAILKPHQTMTRSMQK